MSRYPSAQWRPIRATSTVRVQKDIFCLHTIVGGMTSCWSYFDRLDVSVYSHLIIGGIWGSDAGRGLDGVAWQIANTDYRAAANLDSNYRIISVETGDNAARPIQPWTPKMCTKIVELMVDAHRLDGIPLVMVPDSKRGRRGIAYHRMGCDPYRVSGGEKWSNAYGKDCPTDPRIRQIPGLIARARAIVAGQPPIPEEDDDMAADPQVLAGLKAIKDSLDGLYRNGFSSQTPDKKYDPGHDTVSVAGMIRRQDALLKTQSETNRLLGEQVQKLDEVLEHFAEPGA